MAWVPRPLDLMNDNIVSDTLKFWISVVSSWFDLMQY